MEHPLWITVLVNKLFGKAALALLSALHIQPASHEYPIPNHISMELLVFAFSIVFFLWLRGRISADRPGATQQCMEMLITNPMGLGVQDMIHDNIGHNGEKYMPMLGGIGIFVLFCNLIGIIPGLGLPTSVASVPFGCAIVAFVYYNWCGIRKHGAFKHAMHFLGPDLPLPGPVKWALSIIIVMPVEVFSNLARLLSLTVRLWANMLASELLYGIFLGLTLGLMLFLGKLNFVGYITASIPFVVPPIFIALHIFEAFIQGFVFTILPVIYVAGAVGEEH